MEITVRCTLLGNLVMDFLLVLIKLLRLRRYERILIENRRF